MSKRSLPRPSRWTYATGVGTYVPPPDEEEEEDLYPPADDEREPLPDEDVDEPLR
jgi:hypothetical protein